MKKIILPFVILVLMAAGFYYFYPKENLEPAGNLSVPLSESKTYKNQPYGFIISYSPPYTQNEGASQNYNVGEFFVGKGESVVTISLSKNLYPGTNFYDGFLTISVSTSTNESECWKAQREGDSNMVQLAESKTINGLKFWRGKTSGAAAGTLAESVIYHAFSNDVCYEITLNEFEGNIANYPEGAASQVDKSNVFSKLEAVLDTFKVESKQNSSAGSGNQIVCAQVITPAKNIKTGEIKDYPTPCEVPDGWEAVN